MIRDSKKDSWKSGQIYLDFSPAIFLTELKFSTTAQPVLVLLHLVESIEVASNNNTRENLSKPHSSGGSRYKSQGQPIQNAIKTLANLSSL